MQRCSWVDLKSGIDTITDSLLLHSRFRALLKQSYASFSNNTDYLDALYSDFYAATGENPDPLNPVFSYSLQFIYSVNCHPIAHKSTKSNIAFYDLLSPCCDEFAKSFFSEFSHLPWFPPFLESVIDELVRDLSECLSPCLFDLFSDTLPFGLQIERFHVGAQSAESKPRLFFDQFLTDIIDNAFLNLVQLYPLSYYFLGQTLFYWHHRHLELLTRLKNKFDQITQSSFDSLTSLSLASLTSGDNHNFNRRSYVLRFSTTNLVNQFVCYKPRSLANDCFFSVLCQNILQQEVDSSLVLPISFDFGAYGFTKYISSVEKNCISPASHRRDGMWLYILWFFGFTDCTYENFIFNGDQHVLIDFETAFTGFFSFLNSPASNHLFSIRALMNLSSTRTTFLPRWDLGVDDRVEVDVSGLGNGESSPILQLSLWLNVNSDWMIYRENSYKQINQSSPSVLSDQFISLDQRIKNIVDGFNFAYRRLKPLLSSFLQLLLDDNRLSSRFIFRDTAAYACFLGDLYSSHSLSSIDSYFGVLDKLDHLILGHPDSHFVSWITTHEKLQLFNGDIPYFITDISATTLSSCFGDFECFCKLYTSGLSFVSLLASDDVLVGFQPLFIETSFRSLSGQTNYAINNHNLQVLPSIHAKSLIDVWRQAISSSAYHLDSVDSPFLLTFQCGTTRKDVQLQNCRPDFLSGTLGILFVYYVAHHLDPSCFTFNDAKFFKQLFFSSLDGYTPLSSASSSTLGLSNVGGFLYGLQLVNFFDHELHFYHSSFSDLCVSVESLHKLKCSNSFSLDLFSGLSGYIVGLLSHKFFVSSSSLVDSIDLLLSFQNVDGFFTCPARGKAPLPLGISHGVHGLLLALLHAYSEMKSEYIYQSICKLISAYQLTSDTFLSSFSTDLSWCSGLCGHLVTLSYLADILPEFSMDYQKGLKYIFEQSSLIKNRDLSFCCGQSGILASLIYLNRNANITPNPRLELLIGELRSNILTTFNDNCDDKRYFYYKQDLLDGFSIFPFLDDRIYSGLKYLESLLVFRKLQ